MFGEITSRNVYLIYLTIHKLSLLKPKQFLALDFITTCDINNKFIIFSDSLSVLKAMNHTSSKNPQIMKLLEKCHELLAKKRNCSLLDPYSYRHSGE